MNQSNKEHLRTFLDIMRRNPENEVTRNVLPGIFIPDIEVKSGHLLFLFFSQWSITYVFVDFIWNEDNYLEVYYKSWKLGLDL
jgi:hypothetical protein